MYTSTSLLLFSSIVAIASAALVKWVPNGSFNLPANFKDKKLPCSKQTVVFPDRMTGSVKMQSEEKVKELVLPVDGEIILETLIVLGEDPTETNCTEGYSYYMDQSMSSWAQAGVWSSLRFNEATPDSEKLPCEGDDVEFPNAKYTVILPDSMQSVRSLKVSGETYTTESFLSRASESEEEQAFQLNSLLQTGVKVSSRTCRHKNGCPCQKFPLEIDCSLKYCPQPSCLAPIKPDGYCCKQCGGYITFEIDDDFDIIAFNELVDKTVQSYGGNVVYHIGFTPVKDSRTLQLVVVEKGAYTGTSAEIANYIDKTIEKHWFKSSKLAKISGSPLDKANLGGKMFFSMFFAVALVMGAIYLYYYRLPKIEFPVINRGSRRMFSRFQRRTDSVVSLTRRDSTIIGGGRTAFRNPMYDSRRGRVEVAESVVEE